MQQALEAEQQYPTMRAPRTGTYETVRESEDIELQDINILAPKIYKRGTQAKSVAGRKGNIFFFWIIKCIQSKDYDIILSYK